MATPNPGSHKAVEAGCTCPVVDNSWGNGYYRPVDGPALFVISDDCPLHSGTKKEENETNADDTQDAD